MPGNAVVIVESPAKAKTINKYLGGDYTVLASFGHVRDLPARDGSVRPDEDFEMDWELGERSKKHVDEIARAVKAADRVYLATDPDREGEAIAWHVKEVLRQRRLLARVDVQRVTFNEITKTAVKDAFTRARDVNRELVEAYLARRALDYLVGFTLSPVLWRKLPGSKSAGRVQSVALRLICERESEIEAFRPQEYWTIEADFRTDHGGQFTAQLSRLDGKKLERFTLGDKGTAEALVSRIQPLTFAVATVDKKQVRRNPAPPFITSTLQQEASRKLGFGATRTMRIAQKLYEGVDLGGETVGLITYMRTDGVQFAAEAINAARGVIESQFGPAYLPKSPRVYKSSAKNAQEAHEAIRPTDLTRRPEHLTAYLEADERRLYELIWKRSIACQMESAVFDQVSVDLACPDGSVVFHATGSTIVFDGFLKVYQEDRDDAEEEKETKLPPMAAGDQLDRGEIRPLQHFTQPPPRYSEASLVKKLEELGIGRPSTYATILQVLQDRSYVRLEKKRFIPEHRGRLVTAFLVAFFTRYVEYSFTAELEHRLDEVSGGRMEWKELLREFWLAFSAAVDDTKDLTITQVIDTLDAELGPHFFPAGPDGADPRICPSCAEGRLGLKLSRNGAFIGCSRYPDCHYTRPLAVAGSEAAGDDELADGPKLLGEDPETGLPVTLRRGPYGAYVQLGPPAGAAEPVKGKDRPLEKPKRASIPKGTTLADVDLDRALRLLALPREIGPHPETGAMIVAGLGRFGPYLKHGEAYKSLGPDDDVLTIGMNRAVTVLAEPGGKGGGAARTPGRSIGNHPGDGKPITIGSGRFGPYVKHGSLYASIPKGTEPDAVSLDEALELLSAKAAKAGNGKAATKPSTRGKANGKAGADAAETTAAAPAPKRTKTAAKGTAAAQAAASTASQPAGTTGRSTKNRKPSSVTETSAPMQRSRTKAAGEPVTSARSDGTSAKKRTPKSLSTGKKPKQNSGPKLGD